MPRLPTFVEVYQYPLLLRILCSLCLLHPSIQLSPGLHSFLFYFTYFIPSTAAIIPEPHNMQFSAVLVAIFATSGLVPIFPLAMKWSNSSICADIEALLSRAMADLHNWGWCYSRIQPYGNDNTCTGKAKRGDEFLEARTIEQRSYADVILSSLTKIPQFWCCPQSSFKVVSWLIIEFSLEPSGYYRSMQLLPGS